MSTTVYICCSKILFQTTKVEMFLNNTDVNDSLLVEFPYWKSTFAISFVFTFIVACGVICFNLLVLVALLRTTKKNFKPLDVIHVSLLVASILEDILRTFLFGIYAPSIFRYCVCSAEVGTIYSSVVEFVAVYRPFAFACLGVLQFLVIFGQKRFVSLWTACGSIVLCVGVSLIFVASTVRLIYESDERVFCYERHCPNSRPESGLGNLFMVIVALSLVSYLPSLTVVFVTSICSCVTFKKYYTGGDDQLNRRMLSLPVVMPLATIASTMFEAAFTLSITELLFRLPLGGYYPYWIGFTLSLSLAFIRIFTGSIYPLALIYTHYHIREAFTKLAKRFKHINQVTPSFLNSSST